MGGLFFSIVFIVGGLLFLPLFLYFDCYYDAYEGKCVIAFSLMDKIKLFGGYVSTYANGFVFHKNKNNALLIPYSSINEKRKKFSFFKTFHFQTLTLNVQTSADAFAIFDFIQRTFSYFKLFNQKLKNVSLNLVLTNKNSLKLTGRVVFHCNLFILLSDLLEYFWRKIKNLCHQKIKD
jgi:hypothetical protein